ncbi:MAG: type II secretion system secretin GspD [Deltaproteobacteria bacterium]|nr:type II secretion system secretin GspD [Deltaproteobacteria bacterium]
MKSKSIRRCLINLFCVLLLILAITSAYGALVAGDKGVTPTAAKAVTPRAASRGKASAAKAVTPRAASQGKASAPKAVAPAAASRGKASAPKAVAPAAASRGKASAAKAVTPTPASSSTASQEKTPSASDSKRYITMDFNNSPITELITFISKVTGKNYIIDPAVKGNITIMSPDKVTIEEAYKVFESILEVHNFTTVESGNVIKIIPSVKAKTKDIEIVFPGDDIDPEDRVVTQLIPLKFANPDNIKKLFAGFVSTKSGAIISYPQTGMLIVTDVLTNIKRLVNIITAVDIEGVGEEMSIIPLENATAADMKTTLAAVFPITTAAKAAAATTVKATITIAADKRTNSLIVVASEDDTFRIRHLISLLDKETPKSEGDIRVYYLQNANAEELSTVLTSFSAKQTTTAGKGKTPIVSQDVKIVSDKATNSLIITAERDDYLVLEDVIERLDIPRRMVYIEALIMEVNVDHEFDVGVEWRAGQDLGEYEGGQVGAYAGSGGMGAAGDYDIISQIGVNQLGQVTLPTAFSVGVMGAGVEIGGLRFPTLGAVFRAYQKNSNVHIVSTPQITTTDNEEAEISVGENIPYLTKKETSVSSTNEYTTYEYKDVGVNLKITPQINQENMVRLKIFQKVIKIKEGTESFTPTTLTRSTQTTVIVEDGNTIVIGGMISENDEETVYKVPILGDIPFLGWFFRSKTTSRNRTNLFIFLTPHIIRNPGEASDIYEEKWGYIDGIEESSINMYDRRPSHSEEMKLLDQGNKHMEQGEYESAEECYLKILETNPENPFALLNIGIVYQLQGEADKAVQMYKKLIELDPDDRTFSSIDPDQQGQKLTDIAKDNLNSIQAQ